MISCRIEYGPNNISVDYLPGNANFSYWLYNKVPTERWRSKGEGIWLTCDDVTKDETDYIKRIANAQWGPDGCVIWEQDTAEQAGQLSLF